MIAFPTMGLERQPVRTFFGVPEGYKKAILKESKAVVQEVDPCGANCQKVEEGTNFRWKEITSLEPQDSRFTLVVPIHNEERHLRSALNALAVSDMPKSVNANIVFITNDCTDKSLEIVRDFMRGFGEPEQRLFDQEEIENLKDPELDEEFATVTHGNMTLTHINTSTRSKANALNVGNSLAYQRGDRIAMNIDANNFLEPDAVGHIYGMAYKTIVEEPDGTAVISGMHQSEMLQRGLLSVVKRIRNNAKDQDFAPEKRVSGCLMAWDTEFFNKEGPIPPGAIVDYSAGVLARERGRNVKKDENAIIWGYEPNNLPERLKQYKRGARGRMQISARSPEAAKIVKADFPHLSGKRIERGGQNLKMMLRNPSKIPYIFLKFVMHEYAIAAGKREYWNDPHYASWESLPSTKGD